MRRLEHYATCHDRRHSHLYPHSTGVDAPVNNPLYRLQGHLLHGRRRGNKNAAEKNLPRLSDIKYRQNCGGTMASDLIGRMQAQFEACYKGSYLQVRRPP